MQFYFSVGKIRHHKSLGPLGQCANCGTARFLTPFGDAIKINAPARRLQLSLAQRPHVDRRKRRVPRAGDDAGQSLIAFTPSAFFRYASWPSHDLNISHAAERANINFRGWSARAVCCEKATLACKSEIQAASGDATRDEKVASVALDGAVARLFSDHRPRRYASGGLQPLVSALQNCG